jgi:hypothetical protein
MRGLHLGEIRLDSDLRTGGGPNVTVPTVSCPGAKIEPVNDLGFKPRRCVGVQLLSGGEIAAGVKGDAESR